MHGRAHALSNTHEHQQYLEDRTLRATSRLNCQAAQTLGQQTKLLLYPRPPASPGPAPTLVHGLLEIQLLRLREVALATTSLGQYHRKLHLLLPGSTPAPTLTASSYGEAITADDPELRDIPADQYSAHLFWAYERAKSRWRSFNDHKPTRHARRVFKRKGKGKGKGK